MPELPATAPISRNIGMADSSQFAANTNGVSLSALSATLKLRRYQKPSSAMAPIATPIGTRSPISTRMPAMLVSESASVPTQTSGAARSPRRAMSDTTRSRR